jgi:hypothetical protein
MSAVYEAQTLADDHRVALKLLTTDDPEDAYDQQRMTRFEREASVVSALTSEHVARVFDAGSDPATGTMFIAMEYLEGRDLQRLLRNNRPLRPDVALRIAAQACLGLSAAHKAGFIHRDIKPANLYLSRRGDGKVTVKLLDFGIAKIRDDDNVNPHKGLTHTGNLLGTPLYVSPEQARGIKQIDQRTDIWSLGITIYHALTGHVPYQTESIYHLIALICSGPPAPVQTVAPWVPAEIGAVLEGALRFAPEERFSGGAAMLAAIEPILRGDYELSEAMLVPMAAQALTSIGAVAEEETAPPAVAPRLTEAAGALPKPSGRPLPGEVHETPTAALIETDDKPSPRPWAPLVIATVAAVAVAGLGVLGLMITRSSAPPIRPVERKAEVSSMVATSAPPRASEAALPPSARAAPTRRATLVIEPLDAHVEIEGVHVPATKGVVEIEGVLGSIHRVRISKGTREFRGDVAITEAGVLPPKLTLEPPPQRPVGKGAAPATAPAPAPAPTSKPTSTSTGKLRTSFE